MVRGGSRFLGEALASYFRSLGGEIVTGWRVELARRTADGARDAARCHASPARPDGREPPSVGLRPAPRRFRYGAGVFKLDWALSAPIPWRSPDCARAATVHLGGTLDEVAASESAIGRGEHAERPFVLLAQPSLFDPTRCPPGRHTAWAYCHVPNGSTRDMTDAIESQVERFAPGFRDVILARHAMAPADFETYNANYIGGDINGGAQDLRQLFTRPVAARSPTHTRPGTLPLLVLDPSWRRRARPLRLPCGTGRPEATAMSPIPQNRRCSARPAAISLLHEYRLRHGGREWTVLNTGTVLTLDDESRLLEVQVNRLPYGVALWPSAIALSHEIASRPDDFAAARSSSWAQARACRGSWRPPWAPASCRPTATSWHCPSAAATASATESPLDRAPARRLDELVRLRGLRLGYWLGHPLRRADASANPPDLRENLNRPAVRFIADPFRGVSIRLLEAMESQGWTVEHDALGRGRRDDTQTDRRLRADTRRHRADQNAVGSITCPIELAVPLIASRPAGPLLSLGGLRKYESRKACAASRTGDETDGHSLSMASANRQFSCLTGSWCCCRPRRTGAIAGEEKGKAGQPPADPLPRSSSSRSRSDRFWRRGARDATGRQAEGRPPARFARGGPLGRQLRARQSCQATPGPAR